MNPAIEQLIAIARKEVGTREDAVNNTGARIVDYQGATWLQPGAWPWCAAFCSWVMRELIEEESVRDYLKTYFKRPTLTFGQADKARCRDASAFGWEKWARAIEGNTNGKGERDSASGDGVWFKERERSLTKCHVRIFPS